MIAFLQTYGFWIFFIVLFLLMMRMHGGHGGHGMGGGCGMGGMEHDQQGGHHHHTDGEPKSDDQARVISYDENRSFDRQPYQARVRDLPSQEGTQSNEDTPYVAAQHVHKQ
jgi:hypothetical protein